MSPRVSISPDAAAAAASCARYIAARLEHALEGAERVTLAISGGKGPRRMFERLAALGIPWQKVHVFWVDERAVPPAHEESNYGLAAQTLLMPARVPKQNVHRIQGELDPKAAAIRYRDEIRSFFGLAPGELPQFDVMQLGIGTDAHTASLFPGEPLIDDREQIAAPVYSPRHTFWRVTLLPGVIQAARDIAFLAAGADKAEPVRATIQEPYYPMQYPAQVAARKNPCVSWFLDLDAGRLLSV